jgi:hypothetical protein
MYNEICKSFLTVYKRYDMLVVQEREKELERIHRRSRELMLRHFNLSFSQFLKGALSQEKCAKSP